MLLRLKVSCLANKILDHTILKVVNESEFTNNARSQPLPQDD